jgi:adenylate kinase family enzyme
MRRVVIIGSPGAGKSTLARALGQRTGLPPIHLDVQFWQPGWMMPTMADWRDRLSAIVAEPRWIIDGNYGSALERALPRADLVLWLDYPRRTALRRALWRFWTSRGYDRPDRAAACPERLDVEFLRYIWQFKAIEHPRLMRSLATHSAHLTPVIFRRHGDTIAFLASVGRLQEPD